MLKRFFFFFEAIGKLYHLDDLPADYFFNYAGCFSIWFARFAGDEHHLDGLLARCALRVWRSSGVSVPVESPHGT